MLRKNLPIPTVVLTNTGADFGRMAISIKDLLRQVQGNVSFPLSVIHAPHYMEALPRQLKAYAVGRCWPNLTTEMRCSVIDLLHWMAENPDSWNKQTNYLEASVDIFLFGVKKGTLRFIALPGSDNERQHNRLQSAAHQLGAELVFAEGEDFQDVLNGRENDAFVERAVKEWAASMTKDLVGEWAKILERARTAAEEIFGKGKKRGDINPFMAVICQKLGVPVQFGHFIFYDFDPDLQRRIRQFLA